MREKTIIAVMMLSLLSLPILMAPMTVSAQEQKVTLYLTTDKAYYKYGDTGTLSITVWNKAAGPIQIENITVTFPWFVLAGRETETIEGIDTAISGNETSAPFTVSFTVPAEGRKWTASMEVDVRVDYVLGEEPKHADGSIDIKIEQLTAQTEVLAPIYYLTIAITILLILTLIAMVFMWWNLKKLTLVSSAAPATG